MNILNEIFLLQLFATCTLFFFNFSVNIITLWYLTGIFLITAGFILILDDCDIFIGFLWIIDLGVGLIFFIFILHFSNFLYQKVNFSLSTKFYFTAAFIFSIGFCFLLIFFNPINSNFNLNVQKTWFFFISWYDYYTIFFIKNITELQLLREIYFFNNSFEFFLINFMLFYSVILVINFTFFLKKIFSYIFSNQLMLPFFLKKLKSNIFIRNQNFLKQQNTPAYTRFWKKKNNNTL